MTDTDRVICSAIGCRRTTKRKWDSQEWLCPAHWSMVSHRIKRLRAKIRRIVKRGANSHLDRVDDYLWREAKRQAIERSVGISA